LKVVTEEAVRMSDGKLFSGLLMLDALMAVKRCRWTTACKLYVVSLR